MRQKCLAHARNIQNIRIGSLDRTSVERNGGRTPRSHCTAQNAATSHKPGQNRNGLGLPGQIWIPLSLGIV